MFPIMHRQYISQKYHNFNFSYLHMEPESGLIFKNISILGNLNLRTKFEFTFKFLHIKLIRKEIQQKLYFHDIVSLKPTFLSY